MANDWIIGNQEEQQKTNIPAKQPETTNPTENWGQFLVRNVAKTPVLAYELARSGLGIGNLAELTARKLGAPEQVKTGLRYLLPTTEQAGQEAQTILPEYLTEHKPEDYWAEFTLTELPLIAATGGLSSLPNFLKSVAVSGAALLGGKAGGAAGAEIGKQIGDEEVGQTIGSLTGGFGGVLGAKKLARPSQTLIPKIKEQERSVLQNALSTSSNQLLNEQEAFKKFKQGKINTVKNDIKTYNDRIKELDKLRKPLYEEATLLQGNLKGNTADLLDQLKESKKDVKKGVLGKDQALINSNIRKLEKFAKLKKGMKLADAKIFQKNFNDQIYNRDASLSFKRNMAPIVNKLNEFIENTGGAEHSSAWTQAEEATREIKSLERGKKDFLKSSQESIRDINKQEFSPLREETLKREHTAAKNALKDFDKKTYNDLVSDLTTQNKLGNFINTIESNSPGKYGLAGLGITLGYLTGGKLGGALGATIGKLASTINKEIQVTAAVMQSHPELLKEFTDAVQAAIKENTPKVLKNLASVNSKIKKLAQEENLINEEEASDWIIG
jgi:hypothetical protein